MIYTTCIMAFVTFSYSRTKRETVLIGFALTGLATFITVYYHMSQNPVFHQVAYASLTCATVFRGMYIMEAFLRPALRERHDTPAHADQILKQMWYLALTGECHLFDLTNMLL
jgi:dihydroceramidase